MNLGQYVKENQTATLEKIQTVTGIIDKNISTAKVLNKVGA